MQTDSRYTRVALPSPRLCTATAYQVPGRLWPKQPCYQPTTAGIVAGLQTEPAPRCEAHMPRELREEAVCVG